MPRVAARRIVFLALGVGIVVDISLPGHQAGLNAVVVMVALLGAACVAAGRDGLRRYDPADAWLPAAAIGLAAMALIRADSWLVQADLLFAAALAGGTVAALAGARITRGLVPCVLDAAGAVVAAAFTGAITVVRPQAAVAGVERARPPDDGRSMRDRLRPWLPVYRGLLIATPILLVFALLFASADAVFAGLVRDALHLPISIDLEDLTGRAIVVLLVAWAAAGLFALGAGRLPLLIPGPSTSPATPPRSLGAASAADLARGRGALGSTEAATVLVAVDALFAAFVGLQLAYLFGGRDTLAVAGMTYADYARRGFFELVAVAVLAGSLVVCLDLAVRWRSRTQLAAGVALLALSGVVLASALVRLRLYQDAYGWTELRFVVLVAIGWLAAALGLTAWLVATRRTRWTLHVLGILVLATVAGMSVVGPQSFVADRNLERAQDPSLVPAGGRSGLDRAYLASLGDEAIPAVVAAYDRLPAADRLGLDGFLRRRAAELRADPTLQGWPSFNVTRERARAALAAWVGPH